MTFYSTRSGSRATASQAILWGLAADGGLYVPGRFPQVSLDEIVSLQRMSYTQRAAFILQKYLEDYKPEQVRAAVEAAYGGGKFDCPEVAPVKKLDDETFVLELFHGPTLAFKDMALQLLPHLVTQAARMNGEERKVSILVATSGDTGKAALEGFKDVPGTSCTVFYPQDGVSDVQKLQMVTTGGDNTWVIGVEGNFDDAQTGVKEIFSDPAFGAKMNERGRVLSSANSINFGRLAPQIVYYFSAYADLLAQNAILPGDKVDFCVPTGNFGNILAGYYARNMGLPVGSLWCASNKNNVLTDFFKKGKYTARREFFKTISPSMDILISSNLERLLYEAADRSGAQVKEWMNQLKKNGSYSVDEEQKEWMQSIFRVGCATDEETKAEIKRVFGEGYLMDTHTAVASRVLYEARQKGAERRPTVIVSTASPYKFTQDVLEALEGEGAAQDMDAFRCAEKLAAVTGTRVPEQVSALRSLPIRHTLKCGKEQMAATVLEGFDKNIR